jgi:hypothetical protein
MHYKILFYISKANYKGYIENGLLIYKQSFLSLTGIRISNEDYAFSGVVGTGSPPHTLVLLIWVKSAT